MVEAFVLDGAFWLAGWDGMVLTPHREARD